MTANWRNHPYAYRGYLWPYAPAVVWAAELDYTTTVANGFYGSTDIIQYLFFDTEWVGDTSWIKPGMTVALGPSIGSFAYGWARVRGTTTASSETVVMVWASRYGGALLAETSPRPGELYLQGSGTVYITVFLDYRVWSKPPFLDTATGYWDGQNGAGGTVYRQYPVANAGTMRVAWESGGSASFDFDGSASFAASPKGYLGQLTAITPYTITSSSENGGNVDDNAFDDNAGTYWEATSKDNETIAWKTTEKPRAVDITVESTSGAPSDFAITAYHVDWGVYTIVCRMHSETGWSAGETRRYYVQTHFGGPNWVSPYELALFVYDTEGGGNVAIREIDVFEEDRATTSPYTWDAADGTYDSGSSTAAAPTISFPVGFRYVELSVEDAESTYTGETYVPVLVLTGDPETTELDYTGATITESGYTAGYPGSNAFDDLDSTMWYIAIASGSDWVKIQLTSAGRINGYRIMAYGATTSPNTWTVEGSNDGSTWYLLDTREGETFSLNGTNTYTFRGAIHSYVYYRLTVTARNGSLALQIKEWDLIFDESPYVPLQNFTISEDRHGQLGHRMTFELYDDLAVDTYPEGTLAVYFEDEYYNSEAGPLAAAGAAGAGNVKLWGWLDASREAILARDTGLETRSQITVLDVAGRLSQLPGWPMVIEHDHTWALPAYYNQMAGACIERILYLLARWCSSVAEVTDYLTLGDWGLWSIPILEVSGGDLWEMMRGRAEAGMMRLGCTKHGAVQVHYDYQGQNYESLPAAAVSIDDDDIVSIDYTSTPVPRLHWGWASAITKSWDDPAGGGFTITAYQVVAPGDAPGQGLRSAEQNEMLVQDDSDLQSRAGQLYAYENAPYSRFVIDLAHVGDTGFDPGALQYVALTLSAASAARRGYTWTSEKMWVYEVEIRHRRDGTKQLILHLEDYIVGADADVVS